ncbi:Hypothetical predicted protein [Mytilus galloprovincialis]|uniref:Uncharacterized protein n=1 Tax=Mytilus galloprovincialis TaxID=29158 RepID=A0A8B6BL79_MYTGA|nr:Hypothetical predicted protein [Mytilus galloprovincialis]
MSAQPRTHTRPQRGEERIAQNLEERISLFRPSRSRFTATTSSRQKNKKPRTWTCEFVCLSNRDAIKTPTGEEKVVLKRAGLGNKKIQFCLDGSEELFTKKLFSEEGFNKLRDCGGFELLRCQSNCRLIEIISSKYTPESLRSIIGGQSKIYIRPIQANLSMSASPVAQIANTSEIKEKCRFCEKDILITDLRDHLKGL